MGFTCKYPNVTKAMLELGIGTQTELARLSNVAFNTVSGILTGRHSPTNKRSKDWTSAAVAISSALLRDPSELFHGGRVHETVTDDIEKYMDPQVFSISFAELPENKLLRHERISAELESVLNTLTDRGREVVSLYFLEGMSMVEIAEAKPVCRTRIEQILKANLRKLRHPVRARRLRPLLDEINETPVRV